MVIERPICYVCQVNPVLIYRDEDGDLCWGGVCQSCQKKVDKAIKDIIDKLRRE